MARYMIQASYSVDGARAVLKNGGSERKTAVEKALKSIGGKLEAFYFAFGEMDAFVIVEAPDNITAAGISLATGAAGMARTKTTVLITPEEMDAAAKKGRDYHPPGK